MVMYLIANVYVYFQFAKTLLNIQLKKTFTWLSCLLSGISRLNFSCETQFIYIMPICCSTHLPYWPIRTTLTCHASKKTRVNRLTWPLIEFYSLYDYTMQFLVWIKLTWTASNGLFISLLIQFNSLILLETKVCTRAQLSQMLTKPLPEHLLALLN